MSGLKIISKSNKQWTWEKHKHKEFDYLFIFKVLNLVAWQTGMKLEQRLGIRLWTFSQSLKNQELDSCWQISYSWSRPILLPAQVNTKAVALVWMSVLTHHTLILLLSIKIHIELPIWGRFLRSKVILAGTKDKV